MSLFPSKLIKAKVLMRAAGPYRISLAFPLMLRPCFPAFTLLLILFQPHGILPVPSHTGCVFLQVLHLLFPLPEVSSPCQGSLPLFL